MRNHKPKVDRPGFVQRLNLQLILPLGNASRALLKKLWTRMRPSRTPLGSPAPSDSHVCQRVSSPSYHGVQYTRLSTLMDVDYFRGSMNPDGLDFDTLKVLNPDPSSGSNSEEGKSNRETSMATVGTLCSPAADAFPPKLPNLCFVNQPDPSFSFIIASALRKLRSSVSTGSRSFSSSEHDSLPRCQYVVNIDQPPGPILSGDQKRCLTSCCSPGLRHHWLDINHASTDEYWNKQAHIAAYLAALEYRPADHPVLCSDTTTTRTVYDPSTLAVCSQSSLSSATIPRASHLHRMIHPCHQRWCGSGIDDFTITIIRGLVAQDHRLLGKF